MKNLKTIPVALSIAAALLCVPLAQAQQPESIAAAAKQKSSDKKAKRVITDDDMPQHVVVAPPSAPASATPSAAVVEDEKNANSAADGPAASKPEAGASAEAKPDKIAELQAKIEIVKQERSLLEKKLEKLQDKADAADTENHKRMYQETIDNQQTTLAEFDRKQNELEQQIESEKAKLKEQEESK